MLALVSVVTGLDASWLSSSVFSAPAKVRLAITPATGVGWTVAEVLRGLGVAVGHRTLESGAGVVAAVLTVAAGVFLLYRTRVATLVASLAAFLLVAAAGGPAAWPWYFTWGLVLLAACPGPQRSAGLAVAVALSVFLVKPGGILALPLDTAPAVLALYAAIAAAIWYVRRDGGGGRGEAGHDRTRPGEPAASALVRT
jgi:hypothetical protein